LIPPDRWRFDARAVKLTRAIALDASACAENAKRTTSWDTSW
jgi:hypothetical protein